MDNHQSHQLSSSFKEIPSHSDPVPAVPILEVQVASVVSSSNANETQAFAPIESNHTSKEYLRLAYDQHIRFIFLSPKMCKSMGIHDWEEQTESMDYLSFDSLRVRQIAINQGVEMDSHVEVFLRQHTILHFLNVNRRTHQKFGLKGWYRVVADEDNPHPLLLTGKEKLWQSRKMKKRGDTVTTRLRMRKRLGGEFENVPRGTLQHRIRQTEEVLDEAIIIYVPNNMYAKRPEKRGYQDPIFFATQALKHAVETDNFTNQLTSFIGSALDQYRLRKSGQRTNIATPIPQNTPSLSLAVGRDMGSDSSGFSLHNPDVNSKRLSFDSGPPVPNPRRVAANQILLSALQGHSSMGSSFDKHIMSGFADTSRPVLHGLSSTFVHQFGDDSSRSGDFEVSSSPFENDSMSFDPSQRDSGMFSGFAQMRGASISEPPAKKKKTRDDSS